MIILNKKYKTSKNLLMVSFLLLIVLPTLFYSFYNFFYMANIMKTKITDNTLSTLEQINLNIENEAVKIENYIDLTVMNTNIQSQLKSADFNHKDYNLKMLYEQWDRYFDNLFVKNTYINNVLLVSPTFGFYHYREAIYLNEDNLRESEWYKKTVSMYGKLNWIGMKKNESIINNNSYAFIASRSILDKESFKQIGVISVAVDEIYFKKLFSNIPHESQIFIVDDKRSVILASQHEALGKSLKDFPATIPQRSTSGSYQIQDGKNEYLFIYSRANRYGWRVVYKVPLKTITKELTVVRNLSFIVLSVCLTIFAVFLFIIYKNISKPLQYMVNFINEIETGVEKVDLKKFPCYELLKISSGVVSLVERNLDTSAKLVRTEKKSRKMELAKLQAQVNPHFLYNTLNSIKYIALQNNQDSISELVTSLVKLLKNSISREGEFIPIHEEILNVKHYINIQSIIYENKIQFDFDLDSELDEIYIPNFILQPLVENCIFHGINPNSSEGKITIRNYRKEKNLFFEVEDNGKGMDEQKISQIMNQSGDKNSFSNLGIRGIHEKLILIYGVDYGLKIQSILNTGTTIIVSLPIQEKNINWGDIDND